MKKTLLITLLYTAFSITAAYAECYINTDTILHFDRYRFAKITRIAAVGGESEQLTRAVEKDLDDGVAVQVRKGTKINKVLQLIDDDFAMVEIKGTTCFMLKRDFSCK